MKTVANRKWRVKDPALAARIRSWLVGQGGEEETVTGAYERWRVRLYGAKWTYYSTGTLYVTGSDDPSLLEAQRHVNRLAGGRFVEPSRDFQVGLDETGKGELFGPLVLAAVKVPRGLFGQIEEIIGVADTKVARSARYWEELFARIDFYRAQGLGWATGRISPQEIERGSINRLLDGSYGKLLGDAMEGVDPRAVRIVLDDYGAGSVLRSRLRELAGRGAEVRRETRADDRYLECRLASLVAKGEQQRILDRIRRDRQFQIEGCELGSGNPGDPKTLAWLRAWHAGGRPWPDFVKRSFRTVREIEARPAPAGRPGAQ